MCWAVVDDANSIPKVKRPYWIIPEADNLSVMLIKFVMVRVLRLSNMENELLNDDISDKSNSGRLQR